MGDVIYIGLVVVQCVEVLVHSSTGSLSCRLVGTGTGFSGRGTGSLKHWFNSLSCRLVGTGTGLDW